MNQLTTEQLEIIDAAGNASRARKPIECGADDTRQRRSLEIEAARVRNAYVDDVWKKDEERRLERQAADHAPHEVSEGEVLNRLFDAGFVPPITRGARQTLAEDNGLILDKDLWEHFDDKAELTLRQLIVNSREKRFRQAPRLLLHEEVHSRLSWWVPQLPSLDVARAGMRATLSYDGSDVVFKPAPSHTNESVARKLGLLGANESVEKIVRKKTAQ